MDTQPSVIVVPADQDRWGSSMSESATDVWTKLSSQDTNGAWSAFESLVPKELSIPLHFHHGEDEWFWVLSGQFLFEVGGQRSLLTQGTSLFAPRKIPHRWKNVSGGLGRLLIIAQPAGRVEGFFVALAKLKPEQLTDFGLLESMFNEGGMQICGPPL